MALDILHDPATMDMASSTGFLTACYHATCLRIGAGMLAAPVCSSFVFMPPININSRFQHVKLRKGAKKKRPTLPGGGFLFAAFVAIWGTASQPENSKRTPSKLYVSMSCLLHLSHIYIYRI